MKESDSKTSEEEFVMNKLFPKTDWCLIEEAKLEPDIEEMDNADRDQTLLELDIEDVDDADQDQTLWESGIEETNIAQIQPESGHESALSQLMEIYYHKIHKFYTVLNGKGRTHAQFLTDEMTHGFMAEKFKRVVNGARADRGLFRVYLMTALRNYRKSYLKVWWERYRAEGGNLDWQEWLSKFEKDNDSSGSGKGKIPSVGPLSGEGESGEYLIDSAWLSKHEQESDPSNPNPAEGKGKTPNVGSPGKTDEKGRLSLNIDAKGKQSKVTGPGLDDDISHYIEYLINTARDEVRNTFAKDRKLEKYLIFGAKVLYDTTLSWEEAAECARGIVEAIVEASRKAKPKPWKLSGKYAEIADRLGLGPNLAVSWDRVKVEFDRLGRMTGDKARDVAEPALKAFPIMVRRICRWDLIRLEQLSSEFQVDDLIAAILQIYLNMKAQRVRELTEGIHCLGHAGFMIEDREQVIYVDPFDIDGDPPKADLVLITHDHPRHCSPNDIRKLMKSGTTVMGAARLVEMLGQWEWSQGSKFIEVKPGDSHIVGPIEILAMPAYNTNKVRESGEFYHPFESGYVGYRITLKDERVIYHAGETDLIPAMESLKYQRLDVALLPVCGVCAMSVDEAVSAVHQVWPQVAVPMYTDKDPGIALSKASLFRRKSPRSVKIMKVKRFSDSPDPNNPPDEN